MPIRRHGLGWEVRIQHGGRRLSKTVATRSDAQYLEAQLRQRVNDSRAGRTPRYSLEEALTRWERDEKPRLKSQSWYTSLAKAIRPLIRGRALHEVPAVAEELKRVGLGAGLEPAPINRRLYLLKRLAKLAYKRWHWLENDLGAKIELLPGEKKRSEWVTPTQAKKLIAASRGEIREAIRWAVLTGMRRGEILKAEPHFFKLGAIYLPASITKSGLARAIPLPPELEPEHFPFDIHPTALSKGFQAARERAGMPEIRFHDLRRSYGTWLLQGGADLGAIRDIFGHADVSMTSRYLGTSIEHLRRQIKSLPSMGLSRGAKKRLHRGKRKKA